MPEIHPDITVVDNPSLSDLYEAFGTRKGDWTFKRGYSDLTPSEVEACVRMVQDGKWLPIHVFNQTHRRGIHHLHDMQAIHGSTWCSGFVHPASRGHEQVYLRQQLWHSARRHIERVKGFAHIFCYCLADNPRAHAWVVDCCQFVEAGIMRHAVPEEGELVDIVLFSQLPDDIDMCRAQAVELFPAGVLGVL